MKKEDLKKDIFDLTGKSAIVTGGNTGIGQALLVAIASKGANVLCVGISSDGDKETQELVDATGTKSKVEYLAIDISKEGASQTIIDTALKAFGRIDILFNNAGIGGSFDWSDRKSWDAVININLTCMYDLTEKVGKLMMEQKSGKIINTSSFLGFKPGANVSVAYVSSKHAVVGLTKSYALRFGEFVQVNAIAPGSIETAMTKKLFDSPGVRENLLGSRIPRKRFGSPEDFLGVAILLSSSASDFINGQTILVDGGQYLS